MEYARATARAMHDDHMAVLTLLDRVDQFVQRQPADGPPDETQQDVRMLLADVRSAVRTEITDHFAFEEDELFPIMDDAGADDMTAILKGEHEVLLPLGTQLADLSDQAAKGGFSQNSWEEFRRVAGAFTDGLRGHVDKEEMGLVPALEDILDEQKDSDLIAGYRFA